MGDNYCWKDVTQTQQQKPESPSRLCAPALPGVPEMQGLYVNMGGGGGGGGGIIFFF